MQTSPKPAPDGFIPSERTFRDLNQHERNHTTPPVGSSHGLRKVRSMVARLPSRKTDSPTGERPVGSAWFAWTGSSVRNFASDGTSPPGGEKDLGRGTNHRRSGLSLLEVVLALSILAVSAALLTQITKQATDNGRMAQRLSTAQMLCESKMSEVLAGAIPLTSSSWTQITDSRRRSAWYYKIQTSTAERPNMIGVRLSVTDQPDATSGNPELFFIVRWMIDPSLGLDTLPTSTSTTGASSSGSGGIQ